MLNDKSSGFPAWWTGKPLLQKMRWVFTTILVAFIFMVGMMVTLSERQTHTVGHIMEDYHAVGEFIDRFRAEQLLLRTSIYPSGIFDAEGHETARAQTDRAVQAVVRTTTPANDPRSMLGHAISNAMDSYREDEAGVYLALRRKGNTDAEFIRGYYRLNARAEYINQYAGMLLQIKVEEGQLQYISVRAQNQRVYFLIGLIICICAIVLSGSLRLLQKSMVGPILALSRAAAQITSGHFAISDVPVSGGDELGTLTATFNIMKRELGHTFETLVENAAMEKDLHRQAMENEQMQKLLERTRFAQLQSQMNPHFLFNSLNTVSALAVLENAPQTREMVEELSAFFRYTLESDEDLVSLSRELDIIETYMDIQHRRFGDRLQLRLTRYPEFEVLRIPKFILQPLVENSVMHGLARKPAGGAIGVRLREPEEGFMEISIVDNGIGVNLTDRPTGRQSVGLDNIRKRLCLFDPLSTLDFWSRPGLGTVVRLRFHIAPLTDIEKEIS